MENITLEDVRANNYSMLCWAIGSGDLKKVQHIMSLGIKLDKRLCKRLVSAFYCAMDDGHDDVINYLLSLGLNKKYLM